MEKHIEKITKSVMKAFEGGLKKGWYRFKDKSMTVDKWLKLSDKEKGDYPISVTELGKKEADIDDFLFKIMSENLSKSKGFAKTLIKDVKCDDSGNIEIMLTDEGQRLRKMYEITGLNFSDLIQKRIKDVIGKEFTHYIVTNDKIIRGQLRL